MRRSLVIAMALAAAGALVLLAALPGLSALPLKDLLPTAKAVPGWEPMAKTYLYSANPDQLYVIYDGGDVEYIESGVQEAAQQTYKKGDSLVIITVHRLPDWQKAKAFYVDKRTRMKAARKVERFTDLQVDKAGFTAVQFGQCYGWGWGKHYLLGFSTKTATEADQAAVKAFMSSIAETIRKSG